MNKKKFRKRLQRVIKQVERVVPYIHLNQPYRRHINYIALPKSYMDIC